MCGGWSMVVRDMFGSTSGCARDSARMRWFGGHTTTLVNPKGSPNPIDDIKAADEKKLFVELCRKYLPELRINPDTGIADPGPACELAQDLDNLMEHYGCIFCVHVNLMFSESYDLNNSGEAYGLRV
jgi:hypothetical protein